MTLCDIGNSSVNFLNESKFFTMSFDEFANFQGEGRIFYINVNEKLTQLLRQKPNFVNLEPYFDFDTIYQGLGVDRIAACYTIKDGVVVDAGSAITIDVMSGGIHQGGFIMPGIASYRRAYEDISPRLKCEFNTKISFDAFPQRTKEALSYGAFKSIYLMIKDTAHNEKVYFTGGYGEFLATFFERAICDKQLVFRGMKKVLQENPRLMPSDFTQKFALPKK